MKCPHCNKEMKIISNPEYNDSSNGIKEENKDFNAGIEVGIREGRKQALEEVEKIIDELIPPLQLETCCFGNIFDFKKILKAQIKKNTKNNATHCFKEMKK